MMNIPQCLNLPFDYQPREFHDLINNLSDFSKKNLIVQDNGRIVETTKMRVIWENLKGGFGRVNHSKKALVEYRIVQLLDYGSEKGWIPFPQDKVKIESYIGLKPKITHHEVETYQTPTINPSLKKYVEYHKFDLEPHNLFAKIAHFFKSKPTPVLLDVEDSPSEEEQEEFIIEEEQEEFIVEEDILPEEISLAGAVVEEEIKVVEEPPKNEIKGEEKATPEKERADTHSYMSAVGYGTLAVLGIAVAGAAAVVLLPTATVAAPVVVAAPAASYAASWVTGAAVTGAVAGTAWVAKKCLSKTIEDQVSDILNDYKSPQKRNPLTKNVAAKRYRQLEILRTGSEKLSEKDPNFIKDNWSYLRNFLSANVEPLKAFYKNFPDKINKIEEHYKALVDMDRATQSTAGKSLFEDLAD